MSSEADILQARHLNKRTKLGPPDVYPQAKDQKEDKLNDLSLKKVLNHISTRTLVLNVHSLLGSITNILSLIQTPVSV